MSEIHITKILLENAKKKTFSLYEEDVFLCEISEDTLVHFAITKGHSFRKEKFEELLRFEQINQCLQQAYRFLERRPHLKKELFRKLQTKQFNISVIDQALTALQEKGYVKDSEFIALYIKEQMRSRKSGPLLIKKKLTERGALMPEIELALQNIYTFELQVSIATDVLANKSAKLKAEPPQKRKQKLIQFGLSRGFTWEIIQEVLRE